MRKSVERCLKAPRPKFRMVLAGILRLSLLFGELCLEAPYLPNRSFKVGLQALGAIIAMSKLMRNCGSRIKFQIVLVQPEMSCKLRPRSDYSVFDGPDDDLSRPEAVLANFRCIPGDDPCQFEHLAGQVLRWIKPLRELLILSEGVRRPSRRRNTRSCINVPGSEARKMASRFERRPAVKRACQVCRRGGALVTPDSYGSRDRDRGGHSKSRTLDCDLVAMPR